MLAPNAPDETFDAVIVLLAVEAVDWIEPSGNMMPPVLITENSLVPALFSVLSRSPVMLATPLIVRLLVPGESNPGPPPEMTTPEPNGVYRVVA